MRERKEANVRLSRILARQTDGILQRNAFAADRTESAFRRCWTGEHVVLGAAHAQAMAAVEHHLEPAVHAVGTFEVLPEVEQQFVLVCK